MTRDNLECIAFGATYDEAWTMTQTVEKILTPPLSPIAPPVADATDVPTAGALASAGPNLNDDAYTGPVTRSQSRDPSPGPRPPSPHPLEILHHALSAPVAIKGVRPRKLHLTRPLVAFDLETTGLDKEHDRIIEWGAVKEWPDGRREEFNYRIKPAVPVSPSAERIHGISNEALAHCPPLGEVAPEIATVLEGSDVVGHNLRAFDMPFLRNELARHKLDGALTGARIVDTLRTFRKMVPKGEVDNHRLGTAYKYYFDKPLDGAHGALADARASLEILHAQVKTHPSLPNTVEALAVLEDARE